MLKNIYQWIASDGLLHILVSMVVVLCLQPLVGTILSILISMLIGISKEHYDMYIEKDNNEQQSLHDFICNCVGIVLSLLVIFILW